MAAPCCRDHIAPNHFKLLKPLNELNLFRESNATLPSQVQQTECSLNKTLALIDELYLKVEPPSFSIEVHMEEVLPSSCKSKNVLIFTVQLFLYFLHWPVLKP